MSSGKTPEKRAAARKRDAPPPPAGTSKGIILPGQCQPVPARRSPSKPQPSSASSASSMELLRKENAVLKKTIMDMNKAKGKLMDSERNALLQKILSLEMLKVKQLQELSEKDAELTRLHDAAAVSRRAELTEQHGEWNPQESVTRSLRQQVEALGQQLEMMTRRCHALESASKAATGTTTTSTEGGIPKPNAPVDMQGVEERLNDALEKNRQWLVYDQQREAYVCGLHVRVSQLEQQLTETLSNMQDTATLEKQKRSERLLQRARTELEEQRAARARAESELELARRGQETQREVAAEARAELDREHQRWDAERGAQNGEREQMALVQQRLEAEKGSVGKLQAELSLARQRFQTEQSACARLQAELAQLHKRAESEAKQTEAALELSAQLKSEQEAAREREGERRRAEAAAARRGADERKRADEERRAAEEERRGLAETALRLNNELERYRALYDDTARSAADHSAQVQLLKKVLIQRDRENERLAFLEEEVRNGQGDWMRLEGELNKVLRELRRARERSHHLEAKIASLPEGVRNLCRIEPPRHPLSDDDDDGKPEVLVREPCESPGHARHSSRNVLEENVLEESLLECPNCSAEYPVSRHRDLLKHLDICCQ